jgi:hypothetical protein
MENSEKDWYRKYMKYKAKYMELKKKRQSGGVTFKSGKYLFVLNNENVDANMRTAFGRNKKAPSIFEMNQDFTDLGYRVAYGSNRAELIIDNKKRAEKALEAAKNAAEASGRSISSAASIAAAKTGQVLSAASIAASVAAAKTGQALSATGRAVRDGVNRTGQILSATGVAVRDGVNRGINMIKKGGGNPLPEVIILSEIVTEANIEKMVREIAEKIKGTDLEGKLNTGITIDVAMIGTNKFVDMKIIS